MKGYKGFDKNMMCRGFQFKEGETYKEDKADLCSEGFHFCENPFDVLNYYGLRDGNLYHVIEAESVSEQKEKDSKRVCKEITIKEKLNFKDILQIGIKYTQEKVKDTTSGDYSHSATSGDYSHSATSGNYSLSATSGYCSQSATSGNYSLSATSGYSSHSATSGNYSLSATSGNCSHSATSGYSSHSATRGKESIACAIGYKAQAKSIKGNWLVLSEIDDNYKVICVKTVKVDGKKIKADTYYKLINKKFVEVKLY